MTGIVTGMGAVVLRGGQSQRMGADKSVIDFDGRTLLERVVEAVASAAESVVIVGACGQSNPGIAGTEFVTDRAPDLGPLEGLSVGLGELAGRCRAAIVTGCDYPFLQPAFAALLLRRWVGSDALVVRAGGQLQPLPAVYALTAAEHADRLLASGNRSLHALLDSCRVDVIDAEDLPADTGGDANLVNVNTPQELAEALARLRQAAARMTP